MMGADRALVAALAKGDAVAAAMFDDDFTWVDVNGRIFDKPQAVSALSKPPLGDEAGLAPAVRRYGEVAAIAVERDKVFVLRIWVKRAAGWRLLTYQEVSQNLPAAPHGPRPQGVGQPVLRAALPAAQCRRARLSCLLAAAENRGDASRAGRLGAACRRQIPGGRRRPEALQGRPQGGARGAAAHERQFRPRPAGLGAAIRL
jgi:hypothetical protein